MTKNRTRTPVYLDPGMHPGLEVKGLRSHQTSSYAQIIIQKRESYDLFFNVALSSRLGFKYYIYIILMLIYLDYVIISCFENIKIGKDVYVYLIFS